ncbi:hypothetical protein T492DRAFT_1038363 [Pavlovales sp. CCMP2436]|nr:hypothetical protein T492DRAFT_1038363 [Pavlovales sp. CCMP2436]
MLPMFGVMCCACVCVSYVSAPDLQPQGLCARDEVVPRKLCSKLVGVCHDYLPKHCRSAPNAALYAPSQFPARPLCTRPVRLFRTRPARRL